MRIVRFIIVLICMVCLSDVCIAKTIRINNNRPILEQFNQTGTTYVIRGRIDFKGETIIIPNNSRIRFGRNGVLSNGTLIGNNSSLVGYPKFDGVRLKGTFSNQKYFASWCSPKTISDFVEDVMNLSKGTTVIVDCDIIMNDQKRSVDHLYLVGNNKTITNSDRYYINYGGADVTKLCFLWDKPQVVDPADNYSAVIIYHNLIEKDTTVVVRIVESVIVRDNSFSFSDNSFSLAIYANQWDDLTIMNNQFHNPSKLLKSNKRGGILVFDDNTVILEGLKKKDDGYLIELTGNCNYPTIINNNVFRINNSTLVGVLKGANYRFSNNSVSVKESFLNSLFQGADKIEIKRNKLDINETSKLDNDIIIGRSNSSDIVVEDNEIIGRDLFKKL